MTVLGASFVLFFSPSRDAFRLDAGSGDVLSSETTRALSHAAVIAKGFSIEPADSLSMAARFSSDPPVHPDYPVELPIRSLVIKSGGFPLSASTPLDLNANANEGDLELVLAPGVREPASLLALADGLTPAQVEALASTSETFLKSLGAAAASSIPGEALADVWNKAHADADSTYRNLFGDESLHERSTEAALNALGYPLSGQQAQH